jgi:hypothetical protein
MEPKSLRTADGVRSLVEDRHQKLADTVGRDRENLATHAAVFVTKHPKTGDVLERPGIVHVMLHPQLTLDHLVAGVRKIALEQQACGVLLMVPVVMAEDIGLDGKVITVGEPEVKMAFVVEHLDEKIGHQCWVADVRPLADAPGAEVGPLRDEGDVKLLGSLGSLLPQREMN